MTHQPNTYSIQEVSNLCGLSQHTLRYYEKIGLIQPVSRGVSSKHRVYTEKDLSVLQSLAYLKICGVSVNDMRTYADFLYTNRVDEKAMKELFVRHEKKFAKRMEGLRLQHAYIQCKVTYWEAKCAGDNNQVQKAIEDSKRIAKKLYAH
jgi:DNA-binding transcriptional MerR regulator